MLLRRFREQRKQQPWTAIRIVFAIVVVGVFLALHVQSRSLGRRIDRSQLLAA